MSVKRPPRFCIMAYSSSGLCTLSHIPVIVFYFCGIHYCQNDGNCSFSICTREHLDILTDRNYLEINTRLLTQQHWCAFMLYTWCYKYKLRNTIFLLFFSILGPDLSRYSQMKNVFSLLDFRIKDNQLCTEDFYRWYIQFVWWHRRKFNAMWLWETLLLHYYTYMPIIKRRVS